MTLDTTHSGSSAAEVVRDLMPQLKADLARLVAIPSVSVLGYPEHTRPALQETYDAVVELLHDAGVDNVESLDLPDAAPIVTAEMPGPPGAPTVLLYGHYDIAPVGEEAKWESPPYEASERDGAIYGRGSADSKSNILVHIGALRAWGGRPPVGDQDRDRGAGGDRAARSPPIRRRTPSCSPATRW